MEKKQFLDSSNKKPFLGWIMIVLGGLCYGLIANFTAGGTMVANTLMMADPAVSINRTIFGLGFTFWALTQGIPQPLIGRLIQKKGPKIAFVAGGVVAITIGLLLSNFVSMNGVMFILIYGIGGGLAFVLSSQLASQTLGNNWFLSKRGTAQSVIQTVTVLTGVAAPIMANWIIKLNGGNWRYGYYIFGVSSIVGLVLALFLVNKPSDIGQFPDGVGSEELHKSIDSGKQTKSKVYKRIENHLTHSQAIRRFEFWGMVIMAAITFLVSNLAMSPGPLYFTDYGFSMDILSKILSLRAVVRIVILVALMRYLDRIEPIKLLATCMVLLAIGLILSVNPTSIVQVVMFFFTQSIGTTAVLVLPAVMIANYFGNTDFPRIQGTLLLISGLISSSTSLIAGMIFEKTGSYNLAFYLMASLSIIGSLIVFLIRYPKTESLGEHGHH